MCAGRTNNGQTMAQIVAQQGIERQREMERLAREREAIAAQQQAQMAAMQQQQQELQSAQQQRTVELQAQQQERLAGISARGQAVSQSLQILSRPESQAPTAQATSRSAGVVAPRQATAALKIGATRRAAGSGANVAV